MIKPLVRFRVYPEVGGCFFSVVVWPTYTSMRDATDMDDCQAACVLGCRPVHSRGVRKMELATIHLARPKLDRDVIYHEALHAAIKFAKHKRLINGKRLGEHREERVAYAASESGKRICRKLKKLGIIK